MITLRTRVPAILAIGLFAAAPLPGSEAWAQHNPAPPLPVPQVTPQFNDPGPQVTIPQPGNPVQQLSPLPDTGSPVYSVPRVYFVPEEPSPRIVTRHKRHHGARHRQISRGHVSGGRSGESPRAPTR
jgi:hypothetical protein